MSTEAPVCMGCFVNNPNTWYSYTNMSSPNFFMTDRPGLTDDEKLCLNHLADAWNLFVNMSVKHPDDDSEFRAAIHDAQKMIALRVARRVDIAEWI